MQFDKFFIEGSIVKGKGTDMMGDFEINGTIDQNNEVTFDKQYIGKHNVIYKGTFDGRLMQGKWVIVD